MTEIRTTGGAECKDDIAKFCATVPQARGMLAKCLDQHHDELSAGCKALASKARSAGSAPSAPGGAAGAAGAAASSGAAAPPAAGAPKPAAATPAAKPAPPDAGK
jgi:hypothetical protein